MYHTHRRAAVRAYCIELYLYQFTCVKLRLYACAFAMCSFLLHTDTQTHRHTDTQNTKTHGHTRHMDT